MPDPVPPAPTTGDDVVIWSGEHSAYWRPNGAGYTTVVEDAGRFTREEAEERTRACGPEKQIELRPAPRPENRYAIDRCEESIRELRSGVPNIDRVRHMLTAAIGTLDAPTPLQRSDHDATPPLLEALEIAETDFSTMARSWDAKGHNRRRADLLRGLRERLERCYPGDEPE